MIPSPPYDLLIGLDRSDRHADLCYVEPLTGRRWRQRLDTAPEQLHDWLAQLRQQFPHARVALCLERPAGDLLPFLETYLWLTVYAINPLTLHKFREAFVTSRAKDDTQDADYLAELLRSHADKLTPWAPDDPATRRLQHLIVHRRAVVDERTGLTNRLQALLKQYFPQALHLGGEDLWRPLATDFLLKWPTLQALQKARPQTIQQFYYLHGSRSPKLIAERLERIQKAVALTDEPALLESFVLRVQLIARELALVTRTVAHYDQRIAEAYVAHTDHAIFASFPGAGPVLGPRLLASVGADRERYADARALQCYSGVAPVTKQSGGTHHVHRRYRCPLFLRQSFHEYAKESILWCRWAAAYYWQQREKGSSHHTAVRALAYKWQRIIWKCWQTRTPYDDARYEAALRRNGSPIVARLDQIELGKSPFKTAAPKSQKIR